VAACSLAVVCSRHFSITNGYGSADNITKYCRNEGLHCKAWRNKNPSRLLSS
jgi:hypothetical protein